MNTWRNLGIKNRPKLTQKSEKLTKTEQNREKQACLFWAQMGVCSHAKDRKFNNYLGLCVKWLPLLPPLARRLQASEQMIDARKI